MNVINSVLKTPWSLSRWIRLTVGLAFMMDSFYKSSGMVAIMGAVLVYQALFNLGCNSASCDQTDAKKQPFDLTHNFKKVKK